MSDLFSLPLVFQNVRDALIPYQDTLNTADFEHGKHGDEMVSLFTVLAAAEEQFLPQTQISVLFDHEAERAARIPNNSSAQFYAQGLTCFAEALRDLDLPAREVPTYIKSILSDTPDSHENSSRLSQGQLLKALIKGLSAWEAQLSGQEHTSNILGMSYLFDLGVSYLQARQKSASKLDAVVEVAVNHSPLKTPSYRAESGKLVISVLLIALLQQAE